ncbi:MAG: hypothetical protein ABII12_00700 [Planctomycetota bacterium]
MLRERDNCDATKLPAGDRRTALPDYLALGADIRSAALAAASLHLVRSAGGRLDSGAALETPRVLAGG